MIGSYSTLRTCQAFDYKLCCVHNSIILCFVGYDVLEDPLAEKLISEFGQTPIQLLTVRNQFHVGSICVNGTAYFFCI